MVCLSRSLTFDDHFVLHMDQQPIEDLAITIGDLGVAEVQLVHKGSFLPPPPLLLF